MQVKGWLDTVESVGIAAVDWKLGTGHLKELASDIFMAVCHSNTFQKTDLFYEWTCTQNNKFCSLLILWLNVLFILYTLTNPEQCVWQKLWNVKYGWSVVHFCNIQNHYSKIWVPCPHTRFAYTDFSHFSTFLLVLYPCWHFFFSFPLGRNGMLHLWLQ